MPDLIEPRAEAPQPQEPTVDPSQQPAGEPSGISEPLLQVPALQGIMAGTPPALSVNIKAFEKNPVAELIVKNKDPLMQAGMGFYQSMSGDLGVIYNSLHIHPEDLQAADKAGKLTAIAPPFDSVNAEISKSGLGNPALRPTNVPKAPRGPVLKAPPQSGQMVSPEPAPQPAPAVRQATAALQKSVLGVRAKNLQAGGPTSGPAPGAGRLLNSILRPAV